MTRLRLLPLSLAVLSGFSLAGCTGLRNTTPIEEPPASPRDLAVIKRTERDRVTFPKPQNSIGITETSAAANSVSAGDLSDTTDRPFADDALARALEAGRPGSRINWRNPGNGHSGEIVTGLPVTQSGKTCRQFTHIIRSNGESKQVTKFACKGDQGGWIEQ